MRSALPPIVLSGYLRIRLEFKLEELTGKRFAGSAALAAEAVSAIRTVSSLALERHILARYEDCLRHIEKHSIKALVWTMFWYALSQSISFLAMALVCTSSVALENRKLTCIGFLVRRSPDQYWRVHNNPILHSLYRCYLFWRGRCRVLFLHDQSDQGGNRGELRVLATKANTGRGRRPI